MIIKKLVLTNIRSYLREEVIFPESKILLAGDIGSGKSTILLAIEFALFGTLRSELSGSALLRNGAKNGSVDLEFEIDGNNYFIHRSLKKSKKSIEQEAGYIVVDNEKRELTPIELKAFILNLLNYPKEYLAKSKNLIYRYTVYTPQEEMKRILLENPETRTSILRKIFNVDKYERIKANTNIYTKFLREKQRAFEAMTSDFEEKKKSLDEKKIELKEAESIIEALNPKIKKAGDDVKIQEDILKKHESKIKERNEIAKVHAHNKATVEQKNKQIELYETEIKRIEDETKEKIAETVDKLNEISGKEKQIQEQESSLKKILQENAGIKTLIVQSKNLSEKIKDLENCPTCLQKVADEHKQKIKEEEKKKQEEFKKKEKNFSENIKCDEEKISKLKEELLLLRKLQQEHLLNNQKIKARDEKIKRKNTITESIKANKKEIKSFTEQQLAYEKVLKDNSIEEEYKSIKTTAEEFKNKLQEFLLEQSKFNERVSQVKKYITMLERDINSKLEAKKKLEHSKVMHNWFTDYFTPLLDVIEKHIMARIHSDFNDVFKKWFSILVDDDMLQPNLDDSYTPIILQNGYDIEYNNLSGGERTACALAYRLALNKVINDIFTQAKTKDILILDEPTDGFSEEQLDKMRDVLDQLNLKQILIVSHEQKIEGFVDRIIRVQKKGHVSKIIK